MSEQFVLWWVCNFQLAIVLYQFYFHNLGQNLVNSSTAVVRESLQWRHSTYVGAFYNNTWEISNQENWKNKSTHNTFDHSILSTHTYTHTRYSVPSITLTHRYGSRNICNNITVIYKLFHALNLMYTTSTSQYYVIM